MHKAMMNHMMPSHQTRAMSLKQLYSANSSFHMDQTINFSLYNEILII